VDTCPYQIMVVNEQDINHINSRQRITNKPKH
jgi:hypothetical protein